MNTPSVDAEGVFFASGHTHRPAPAPASALLWHETGGNTTSCDPQKNSAKVLKCCPCNDRILLPEKRKLIDVRQYARIRIAVATDREN